ncbi:MAG: hypothetical protein ACR2I2_11580 [Bryobacteraceae bacterium]
MKSRFLPAFFCVACAAVGQSLSAPRAGFMLDRSHRIRPVFGMAGNFVLGEALAGEVLSLAFSGKSGLAKTETQLLLLDRDAATIQAFDAPPGKSLFAFHADGTPAYCYFEATGDLARIGPDGLEPLEHPVLPDGFRLIGIADDNGTPRILTADSTNAPTNAPSNAPSNVIRKVQQLGEGWMQIDTVLGTYARRTETGAEYRLPVPEPVE